MIEKIQCVIIAGRGQGPQPELAAWLSNHGVRFRVAQPGYASDAVRNRAIMEYLKRKAHARPYLLLIDADMVPVDTRADAILREPGAALWCGYVGTEGSPAHEKDVFGVSCCRLAADLLKTIGSNWCQIEWDEARERVVRCDCARLDTMIRSQGETPRQVGVIGHAQRCVILPEDNAHGWGLIWPSQLG